MPDNEPVEMLNTKNAITLEKLNKNIELPLPLLPQSKVVEFLTDQRVPPNQSVGSGGYQNVDGYHYMNVFVRYDQFEPGEGALKLGILFALDGSGRTPARAYATLEPNMPDPQMTQFIDVEGKGAWHGTQWNTSSFVVRVPVMGPYADIFVTNFATRERTVTVSAYLVR